MRPRFFVVAVVVSFSLIVSAVVTVLSARKEKTIDPQPQDVLCKISLQIGMFELAGLLGDHNYKDNNVNNLTEHKHIEMLTCELVDSISYQATSSHDYKINVPDPLFQEYRNRIIETRTNPIVSITDVTINGHEIDLADTSTVEQVAEVDFEISQRRVGDNYLLGGLRRNRRRAQQVVRTVLILRVITTDSRPTYSRNELRTMTFDDPVSLKWQMYKCSGAKVDLRPEPTHNGVLPVRINIPAQGTMYYDVVDEAKRVALQSFPDDITAIRQVADHIMIVLPPGTDGGLLAAGQVGGRETSYSDLWGGSVSGTMHELGHNLALYHAGDGSDRYGDKSGYMGYSRLDQNKPAKCYNGANFGALGWFADRLKDVDVNTGVAQYMKLTTFVDYDRTSPGEFVLLRVGELYMVYNKAKRHNDETDHHPNRLTVVRNEESRTDLLSALDISNPIGDLVEGGRDIRVEICDVIHVNNVDSMIISVGPRPSSACEEYRTSTEPGLEVLDEPLCPSSDACGDNQYWVHRPGAFFSCDEVCTSSVEEYLGFQYTCGRC